MLLLLPSEFFAAVVALLPNRAVKQVRLTCRALHALAPLRLPRVFLSTSPRDVAALRAVAAHDELRRGVVVLVWDDDAQLPRLPPPSVDRPEPGPRWFGVGCRDNVDDVRSVAVSDLLAAARRALENPTCRHAAWDLYRELVDEQPGRTGHARGAYELLFPWTAGAEEKRIKWRGFGIVTRELARVKDNHKVMELVLDARHLETGLNCRIFDEPPCEEYNDLVQVLRQPGFRRLDLALLSTWQDRRNLNWSAFRSGLLERALGEATQVQHISLRIHTLLKPDDLLSLLAALPAALRSVELAHLEFLGDNGKLHSPRYGDLL
ncbi:hypothetical protein GGR56DRAFT_689071 [Xylariaceae sp. FL0804]|nr:hypothetical protein GGR56DRAFT_689071 [Xylariaceae sp. FL0804]